MLPSRTIPNLFPPVTLSGPAREAIRAFGKRHKSRFDSEHLEVLVGRQTVEFSLVNANEPWFDAHPRHPFVGLVLTAQSEDVIDQLELVVTPQMTGPKAPHYTVTDLQETPLPEEYFVQRVIAEAQTVNT